MKNPWFPIALMLIVVLTVWLGIFGPLQDGFWNGLQKWQTLVGATVALIAAGFAIWNTTRSLRQNKQFEEQRRTRKHAALRAVLPLALSQVSEYAERSAHALDDLASRCSGGALPRMAASGDLVQPLPSDTLKTLTDFIEYSDNLDVAVIESTIAWIQIHDARLRSLVKRNRTQRVIRAELEARIIDAASIAAGAGTVYEYARRQETQLQHTLPWAAVRNALGSMRFWENEHPELYAILSGREQRSAGPFGRLNA
jgi:hypothetical protein